MKICVVLTVAVFMILAPLSYGSDISMTVSGTYWDGGTKVNPGCLVRATFRLTNTSGEAIKGFSNGFRFSATGASHITFLKVDTLSIGWSQYFDGFVGVERHSFDGMGVDTVGFGGFAIMGPGIPPGFSQDVWYIDIIVEGAEGILSFDTAFFPPGGVWLWTTNGGDVLPQWSGARIFPVQMLPCGITAFRDPVTEIHVPVDGPYSHRFVALNSMTPGTGPTAFDIVDGPGELMTIDDSTCEWHITATPADLGRIDTLFIQAADCGACASQIITLTFCEPSPLEFGSECSTSGISIMQGESGSYPFSLGPCSPPLFIADNGGAPGGVCFLDGTTVRFNSTVTCRGYYPVQVGQTDGVDSVFCMVPVLVSDPVCYLRGNVDGKMMPTATVNVADLTYLVSYLFRGGMPPANAEEGNIDGTGDMNVSDLTFLVNFLFKSGSPPPACD